MPKKKSEYPFENPRPSAACYGAAVLLTLPPLPLAPPGWLAGSAPHPPFLSGVVGDFLPFGRDLTVPAFSVLRSYTLRPAQVFSEVSFPSGLTWHPVWGPARPGHCFALHGLASLLCSGWRCPAGFFSQRLLFAVADRACGASLRKNM